MDQTAAQKQPNSQARVCQEIQPGQKEVEPPTTQIAFSNECPHEQVRINQTVLERTGSPETWDESALLRFIDSQQGSLRFSTAC